MTDEKEALVPALHLHRQRSSAEDADSSHHVEEIMDLFRRRICDPSQYPKVTVAAVAHWALTQNGVYAPEDIGSHSFRCSKPDSLEAECAQVAEALFKAAKKNSAVFDRPQRYAILVYSKAKEMVERYDFLLAGSVQAQQLGGETEPANAFGVLAASLRWCEGMARTFVASNHEILEAYSAETERLRQHQIALEKQAQEMIARQLEYMEKLKALNLLELELAREKMKRDLQGEAGDNEKSQRLWGLLTEVLLPTMIEKAGAGQNGAALPLIQQAVGALGPGKANGAAS